MDELSEMNLWLEGSHVEQRIKTSAFDPYDYEGMVTHHHHQVHAVGGGDTNKNMSMKIMNMNMNMNKRMVEFLRRSKPQKDRCFRHMMNERMRRERHKNSFSSLHALLPHGTKTDKNSIMQMAGREIQVMRRYKEELRSRNKDMERHNVSFNLPNKNNSKMIDSLLDLLNCLNPMGSDIISIQSHFTNQPPQLLVQFKSGGVGKAVGERLDEVEKKFQGDYVEANWMG